jgi:hypothetical protein
MYVRGVTLQSGLHSSPAPRCSDRLFELVGADNPHDLRAGGCRRSHSVVHSSCQERVYSTVVTCRLPRASGFVMSEPIAHSLINL